MKAIQQSALWLLTGAALSAAQVGIVVNRDLYPEVQSAVETYVAALAASGETVWVNSQSFSDVEPAATLRDTLRNRYEAGTEGVVFIGDLPIAMFEMEDDYPRYHHGYKCWPTDLYFMDVDGRWEDTEQSDAMMAGYYDRHSGNRAPEIWVSRITPSVTGAHESQAAIVNDYFERVKQRMGTAPAPSSCLLFGDDGEPYWRHLAKENQYSLGFSDEQTVDARRSTGTDVKDTLLAELAQGHDYLYLYEHSAPALHASGEVYSDWFTLENLVSASGSTVPFFNLFACDNAKYTEDNMATAYALLHGGLISMGSSKTGGMLDYTPYNGALRAGKSFGEAFKAWFTEVGIHDLSWHYGMTLQGAGTLCFTPTPDPYIELTFPVPGMIWGRGSTKEILWSDNIEGDVRIRLVNEQRAVTVVERTESDGSFQWEIPRDLVAAPEAFRLVVEALDEPVADTIARDFTIRPFAAEVFVVGGTFLNDTSYFMHCFDSGAVLSIVGASPYQSDPFSHWSGDNGGVADIYSDTTTVVVTGDMEIVATYGDHPVSAAAALSGEAPMGIGFQGGNISLALPQMQRDCALRLYSLSGRLLAERQLGRLSAGQHRLPVGQLFGALPKGVWIASLQSETESMATKIAVP